jgi:hypothetical protein
MKDEKAAKRRLLKLLMGPGGYVMQQPPFWCIEQMGNCIGTNDTWKRFIRYLLRA